MGQYIQTSMQNLESVAQKMAELLHNYDKLSAIGHTSVSQPSQKSGHLLGHPRNLEKVAY